MARKVILTILLLSVAFSSWAVEWFAYGGSFGTGIVLNNDSSLRSYAEDMHRVVLELDGTMEFIFHPSIRVAAGSILLTDFKFKGDEYYNSLDYSIYGGIRIYPGLGGLRLGVDYNLGRRTDFIDIPPVNDVNSSAWGNGFRFLLEYDFRYAKTGLLPMVGGSWRYVPRGGDASDHIISVYFKLLYR